jgi:DNA-binding Lrp family transcriptional regulator
MKSKKADLPSWAFFSNHGHTIVLIARNGLQTMREMAAQVGVTERAMIRIISDLERDNYIKKIKIGRNNSYRVNKNGKFRHPIEHPFLISAVLDVLTAES